MAYTSTNVINRVSTVLNDPSTATWGTALIGVGVTDGLREIATYKPRVVLATVTPSAGTPDLDISGTAFANLLYGRVLESFDEVEFKVDEEPKKFRNFKVHSPNLTMDISFEPDGSDAARLYCFEPHILGGAGTTSLSPEMERLLVDLVASRIAIDYSFQVINAIPKGGARTYGEYISWGEKKLGLTLNSLRALIQPKMHIRWPTVD